MSERPKGFGMTAELQYKLEQRAGKYDARLDLEARQWLEEVTGEPFPTGLEASAQTLHDALKDGQYLCKAINAIQPGSVKKINTSKMAFRMMENIGNFLDGCCAYGLTKQDLFQIADLYDNTNIPQVINGIHALGRKAKSKGHSSGLGPKEASGQKREFTKEQDGLR